LYSTAGLRTLLIPIALYLCWYTYTHEPPWPTYLFVLCFLGTFLSWRITRVENQKAKFEQNLKNSTLINFNYSLPKHFNSDIPKPIERNIGIVEQVSTGLWKNKYSEEEAINIAETLMQTQNYEAAKKWFSLVEKSNNNELKIKALQGKVNAQEIIEKIKNGEIDSYQLRQLEIKGFIELRYLNKFEFSYNLTSKISNLDEISKLSEIQRELLVSLITEAMVNDDSLDY
jgi:hypothetical protein